MKIKPGTIAKICIGLFVLMNLCYFLIAFSNTTLFADSFISKPRMMLFLGLILFSLICCIPYKFIQSKKYLYFELLLLAVVWCRAILGDSAKGYSASDIIGTFGTYFFPILSIALMNLLAARQWKLNKLLNFLILVITIDTVVRGMDSLLQVVTGVLPWPNLVVGEMGYRNDIYRINPTGFDILVIPISFYLLSKAQRKNERILYWSALLINLLYTFFIWQGRSAIIYKICICILLFYLQKTSDRKKMIRFMLGIVAIIVLVNTPFISNYLSTFSTMNAEYGGSTLARLNSASFFYEQYKNNIFWGIGHLFPGQTYAIGGGMLEDCGFLYGIFQYGIPMIIFYIALFGRGIYISYKLHRYCIEDSLFSLSLTLMFLMFGINIDTFYFFAVAVPFYMAIVEYLFYKEKCFIRRNSDIKAFEE